MLRSLLVAVLAAAAALAQTSSPGPPPGSISGVVRNAVTRAPLEGVRVYVHGSPVVKTNSQGRFAISGVEAGRQWLSAYDESRAASGNLYVLVNPGQEVTGVEVPIKLGGRISGKVIDDNSRPVAGVSVLLLERRFEFGEMVYAPRLTVSTDENGGFRLEPVPSERGFLILARTMLNALKPADDAPVVPEKRRPVLIPTYYPDSRYGQDAQTVTLTPDESRERVDIRMASDTPYCIEGSVVAPGRPTPPSVTIAEQQPLVSGSKFAPASVKTTADGRFRACGFHPGDYQLAASSTEGARSQRVYANAEVAVTSRDVHDVKLLARSPGVMSGDVSWDPPPRANAAGARISVYLNKRFGGGQYADEAQPPSSVAGAMSIGGRLWVPGPFALEGIPLEVDDYELEVGNLPAGCYAKEASYGGVRVHGQLRLTRAVFEGRMRLVLACDGGSLTARVTDHDGNAVSQAHLYLMPAGAASEAAVSDVIRRGDVEKGWSSIRGPIVPGKYLAIACQLELDGTVETLQKLWQARSLAKEVEVGPNAVAQVILELVELN